MATPYPDELRRKLLFAYREGRGGLEKLASLYGVSYGWAQKVVAAHRKTGGYERPRGGKRGFPSKVTPEIRDRIRERMKRRSETKLAELRSWLLDKHSVEVSVSHLSVILKEMGLNKRAG